MYVNYYRDKDAKGIDIIIEGDEKTCSLISKGAKLDRWIVRTFGTIDKSPIEVGIGASLCMAKQLDAFDKNNSSKNNLIWMIE